MRERIEFLEDAKRTTFSSAIINLFEEMRWIGSKRVTKEEVAIEVFGQKLVRDMTRGQKALWDKRFGQACADSRKQRVYEILQSKKAKGSKTYLYSISKGQQDYHDNNEVLDDQRKNIEKGIAKNHYRAISQKEQTKIEAYVPDGDRAKF